MSSTTLRPGDRLGGYRIAAQLGSGGMGEVYLAEDLRLDRRVALKVLTPDLAQDAASLKRFEREAKAASALNHPSILTIHELGEDRGITFIAGELVEGETLRRRIERGPLPVSEALDIALQAASALSVAHDAGILHRDIKPENVMIRRDGLVKVLDFGLAKLLAPSEAPEARTVERTTMPGTVVGTIHYMSPEQARGGRLDQRSDIFSFAAMLYEMVTGVAPFDGETWSHVMVAILESEPPPLDHPELQRIIAKALRKDPSERYPTMAELAADLRNVTRGDAITKPMPPRPLRKRVVSAVAAAIVTASIVAGAWLWSRRDQGPQPRIPIAVADFDNRTGEQALDGLSGMLITSLEQSRRLSVMTRPGMFDALRRLHKPEVARIDEATGREIAQSENMRGLVSASVTKLGALYVIDMKLLDPATNEYIFTGKVEGKGQERIPAMIDSLSERLRLSLNEQKDEVRDAKKDVGQATTENLEAYYHYFRSERLIGQWNTQEAEAELKKALELDPTFALAWLRLARLAWTDERSDARQFIAEARRFGAGMPEKERLTIAAVEAQIFGNHARGMALRRQILARFPNDKESLFAVGDYALQNCDYKTARQYLEGAVAVDPQYDNAYRSLIWTGLNEGDIARAVADGRRYVRQAPSPMAYSYLISALWAQGLPADALSAAAEARTRYPGTAEGIGMYAMALNQMGNAAGAVQEMERLRQIPETLNDGTYALRSGFLAIQQGRFRDAAALYERGAAAADANGMRQTATLLLAWRTLLLARWGRTAEARAGTAVVARHAEGQSSSAWGLNLLFVTYMVLGDVEAGKNLAARLSMPGPYHRHFIAGAEALRRGDPGGAVDAMQGAPAQGDIDLFIAKCALAAGRLDVVEKYALRASGMVAWEPPNAFVYSEHLLGRVEETRGNRAAAKKHYQNVLDRWRNADPDIPELVDTKARLAKL